MNTEALDFGINIMKIKYLEASYQDYMRNLKELFTMQKMLRLFDNNLSYDTIMEQDEEIYRSQNYKEKFNYYLGYLKDLPAPWKYTESMINGTIEIIEYCRISNVTFCKVVKYLFEIFLEDNIYDCKDVNIIRILKNYCGENPRSFHSGGSTSGGPPIENLNKSFYMLRRLIFSLSEGISNYGYLEYLVKPKYETILKLQNYDRTNYEENRNKLIKDNLI